MECKKMRGLIMTDYLDGNLDKPTLKEVEAHIAACPGCRGLVSELTSIRASLKKESPQSPPPQVWERIRADIARVPMKYSLAGNFAESIRSWIVNRRPAVVIAAAAILIFAVLTVTRLMPQNNPLAPDDIISIISLEENGDYADYNFGTPAENYFL